MERHSRPQSLVPKREPRVFVPRMSSDPGEAPFALLGVGLSSDPYKLPRVLHSFTLLWGSQ